MCDFESSFKNIKKSNIEQKEQKNILKEFKQKEIKIYIYGAGYVGEAVCEKLEKNGYNVTGFIDKNRKLSICKGYPVSTLDKFDVILPDSIVIIAVLGVTEFPSIKMQLKEKGFTHIFDFVELRYSEEFINEDADILPGIGTDVNKLICHQEDVIGVYNSLNDMESKESYKQVISFCAGDSTYDFTKWDLRPLIEQYFSYDVYTQINNEVFVDCGAFTGDTMETFLKNNNNCFDGYYAVEPDPINRGAIIEKIESQEYKSKVHIIAGAVSNQEGNTEFAAFSSGYSNIYESGKMRIEDTKHQSSQITEIDLKTLDCELKNKKITFIKMDIEGSELKALKGAKDVISKNHPVLAICLYHKIEDLWEIPIYIKKLYFGYKFYFRNYRAISEYVLYAVPECRLVVEE